MHEQVLNKTSPFDIERYKLKAQEIGDKLLNETSPKARAVLHDLLADEELLAYQEYANNVAVRRLYYNDHGSVHMRLVALYALRLLKHLRESGIASSIEQEQLGTYEDSEVAILFAGLLHDVGMGVTRMNHEWHSLNTADRFLDRYLPRIYPKQIALQCVVRSLVHEMIVGHMATEVIHSIEAGIVLVADGADMSHGRSKIVGIVNRDAAVGDMHKHSADAVQKVIFSKGETKPVLISVEMNDYAGIFQIEEVLMAKIEASTIKRYLELRVIVHGQEPRYYLR